MAKRIEKRKAGGDFGREWLPGALLVLAVFLAYVPVWKAGYIWDDDAMLTQNGTVIGPFGLKEIWTTGAADICPFTLTTFWLEHKLWGLAPLPYHLVSVLMHGVGAVVLWRVLRGLKIPGAWLGAALWALHPVQVESVAWISEMKNTESGLFYLLSILFFLKWLGAKDGRAGNWNYALTLLFAAFAMTSKSSTVVLPVVLCLCAWWMGAKWQLRDGLKLVSIFFMSVFMGIVSICTQNLRGANDSGWMKDLPQHIANGGAAVWFYLGKLLWPYPLLMIYPHSEIDPGQPFLYLPLLAVIVALVVFWVKRESWARPWFFAFAYFVVALLPVLGLLKNTFFEYSPVFDHFQYLASMAPLALVGAGIARLASVITPGKTWLPFVVGAPALVVLGILSWQHARVFRTDDSLWTYMLKKDPNCWAAYTSLAVDASTKGDPDKAIGYLQKSLEINPGNPQTQNDLGVLLNRKGKVDEAVSHFKKALEISPNYPSAHRNLADIYISQGNNEEAMAEFEKALENAPNDLDANVSYGVLLGQKGETDEALSHFQKAVTMNPNFVEGQYNLGNALLQTGQVDQAIDHFQTAEKLDPLDFRIHNNLGRALAQKGKLDEAIVELRAAADAQPKNTAVLQNLARVLAGKGKTDDAITELKKALEIDGNDAKTYNLLGNTYFQILELDDAIDEYQKALLIEPDYAECRRNLGYAFFQKGKLGDAVFQYEKSLTLNPNDAPAHNNLGIILAKQGQLAKAVVQFQAALQLKPDYFDAQRNLDHAQKMIQQNPSPGG